MRNAIPDNYQTKVPMSRQYYYNILHYIILHTHMYKLKWKSTITRMLWYAVITECAIIDFYFIIHFFFISFYSSSSVANKPIPHMDKGVNRLQIQEQRLCQRLQCFSALQVSDYKFQVQRKHFVSNWFHYKLSIRAKIY